jgi:hypothetical protein
VLPEALTTGEFELEGQVLRTVSVGQGDTEFSTVLHVPSAAAVVGGDVVCNGVHMMTAETDENSREAWIASLDKVAALNPQIVVAGHKSAGAPDLPESIGASQQYLRDFSRIVNAGGSVEDVVNAMLKLHGDRANPRTPVALGPHRRRQTWLTSQPPTANGHGAPASRARGWPPADDAVLRQLHALI